MIRLKELFKGKYKIILMTALVAVVVVIGAVIAAVNISSDDSLDRTYQAELEAKVTSPLMEITNKKLITRAGEKWEEEASKQKEEEASKKAEELKKQEEERKAAEEKAKKAAEEAAQKTAEEEKIKAIEEEQRRAAEEAKKESRANVIVCLDPGHGGAENGTFYRDENVIVQEKDINFQIALGVKARLEGLGIKVVMTRNGDYNVGLKDRVAIADDNGAKILVSIHNNASSRNLPEHRGCMVIVTQSNYNNVKEDSLAIAYPILAGLKALGINYSSDWDASSHNGIMQRADEPISYYPDGSVADYYTIINESTSRGLPSVIVEHAFLNNKDDYYAFFSTPQKVDALAQADANGIIAYLTGKGYI